MQSILESSAFTLVLGLAILVVGGIEVVQTLQGAPINPALASILGTLIGLLQTANHAVSTANARKIDAVIKNGK